MSARTFNALTVVGAVVLLIAFAAWWGWMLRSGVPHEQRADVCIDDSLATMCSTTIVGAARVGSETHLELSDGRVIVVRGYKGHHVYERPAWATTKPGSGAR